jgi:hypothetical protein
MTNDRLNTPNREQWLRNVTNALRPHFEAKGFTVPANVQVTCGFPSKAATSRKNQRIGECWDASRSDGKVFEIFISPVIADALEAAAILAHELVHATVGLKAAHKGPFKRCALAIGLTGKMTATTAGDVFKLWFADRAGDLGAYPHSKLNATSAPKKQTTRMVKCECFECRAEGKPYIVRLSASTLEQGAPICPVHNTVMGG